MANVFVSGGTGYIGRALTPELLARGHRVRVLSRAASVGCVPAGATPVVGDALDGSSFAAELDTATTLVHLVGTPHPTPAKAMEFERVDLGSIRASVEAARQAPIAHLVYVSVAHPAPLMHAYIGARVEGEAAITSAGLRATVLRPWYVVGPGHRWPIVLVPLYRIAEWLPGMRESARRLGLVTLAQMVAALVRAVENPPGERMVRVVDVAGIRAS